MEDENTENQSNTSEPRSIDKLYEVQPSEMTAEELDIWIDYKCQLAARDAAYQAKLEANANYLQSVAKVYSDKADAIVAEMRERNGNVETQ